MSYFSVTGAFAAHLQNAELCRITNGKLMISDYLLLQNLSVRATFNSDEVRQKVFKCTYVQLKQHKASHLLVNQYLIKEIMSMWST